MAFGKATVIGVLVCFAVCFSAFDIAAIVIAEQNEQTIFPPNSSSFEDNSNSGTVWSDPCLSSLVNFNMRIWLLTAGAVNLSVILLFVALGIVSIIIEFPIVAAAIPILIINGLFKLAWWIVGVIIIATVEDEGAYVCSKQYQPIWVMTIVQLVVIGVALFLHCLAKRGLNSDD